MQKRSWHRTLGIQVLVFLGLLVGLEVVLRVVYYSTKSDIPLAIVNFMQRIPVPFSLNASQPMGELEVVSDAPDFVTDSVLGYRLKPGAYKTEAIYHGFFSGDKTRVTTSTVNEEGYRVTQATPTDAEDEIWIIGCSFAYGLNINDDETYPWRIQSQLKGYTVKNYGVPGYGNLQNLMMYRQLLQHKKPKLAVFTYGDMHLYRNVQTKTWLSNLRVRSISDSPTLPAGYLDEDSQLRIEYLDLSHGVENLKRRPVADEIAVTKTIFDEIIGVSRDNEVPLLVATYASKDNQIQAYIAEKGVPMMPFDLDIRQSKYNLMPFDGHPNALANEYYANALLPVIQQYL